MQRSTMVCVRPSDFIFAEFILWKCEFHFQLQLKTWLIKSTHFWHRVYDGTDLRLSSAPPTTTMLLSALSFSLNSSIPSILHCKAFWPTTNNTGVFMSRSGSSTSCKPREQVNLVIVFFYLNSFQFFSGEHLGFFFK